MRFLFISVTGPRAFILQLVNSKGDIRNCRIGLLNGLVLQKVLYCGDPLYEEAKKDGFGSIEISPSVDSYFEIQPIIMNNLPQNGIKIYLIILKCIFPSNFAGFSSPFCLFLHLSF